MEWLRHLNEAVAYMESCLEGGFSLGEAARIACCSPDYFRRMFGYVAGVSPAEYLQRRRMTQAAFLLQHTGQTVTEVALRCGYASPAAFDRAFRQVHGVTPTEARRAGSPLNAYLPVAFSVRVTGERPMVYRIEHREAFRLEGVRTRIGPGTMEEIQRQVPEFWQRTLRSAWFSTLESRGGGKNARLFGVSDCRGTEEWSYTIAVEWGGTPPAEGCVCALPVAWWAVFETEGPYRETVQAVFRRFFTEWLPFSGWRYAGLPDVEVYPAGQPESGRAEVWFAIRREEEE